MLVVNFYHWKWSQPLNCHFVIILWSKLSFSPINNWWVIILVLIWTTPLLPLKVIDVAHPVDSALELCYDPDWLMVTKATSGMFPSKPQRWVQPLVMDDHKYVLPLYACDYIISELCVCVCACVHGCVCACMHGCMHACACISTCVHAWVCDYIISECV